MINFTPKRLQKYVLDYDYEVTINRAKAVLEILDDAYGIFESQDIEMATDYILLGEKSIYAEYF